MRELEEPGRAMKKLLQGAGEGAAIPNNHFSTNSITDTYGNLILREYTCFSSLWLL